MISVYSLKPAFQKLLRPVARWLYSRGVSANQVTLAALWLAVATGGAVALWPTPMMLLLLPPVLFVRMALNALDGMLAREFWGPTPLGAVLNELGDVLADAAMVLPLALIPGVPMAPVVSLVLLALLSEFCGVVAVQIGASRRYDGPMGKSDRAFVFGALGTWVAMAAPLPAMAAWVMPVIAALLAWTVFNRVRRGLLPAA